MTAGDTESARHLSLQSCGSWNAHQAINDGYRMDYSINYMMLGSAERHRWFANVITAGNGSKNPAQLQQLGNLLGARRTPDVSYFLIHLLFPVISSSIYGVSFLLFFLFFQGQLSFPSIFFPFSIHWMFSWIFFIPNSTSIAIFLIILQVLLFSVNCLLVVAHPLKIFLVCLKIYKAIRIKYCAGKEISKKRHHWLFYRLTPHS